MNASFFEVLYFILLFCLCLFFLSHHNYFWLLLNFQVFLLSWALILHLQVPVGYCHLKILLNPKGIIWSKHSMPSPLSAPSCHFTILPSFPPLKWKIWTKRPPSGPFSFIMLALTSSPSQRGHYHPAHHSLV